MSKQHWTKTELDEMVPDHLREEQDRHQKTLDKSAEILTSPGPDGYQLVIFDLDGTLADRDTGLILPGVYEWFAENRNKYEISIATNQGGVGLRYWMESDGFGDPEKFPTESDIEERIVGVLGKLKPGKHSIYICYAYQSKKTGKWSPYPLGMENMLEWDRTCRKPEPGMLLYAMDHHQVLPDQTVFIGDSDEDSEAAHRAGVEFVHADVFFGRVTKDHFGDGL